MNFIDSSDWQIRERVAYSAIHIFQDYIDKMPLESIKRLVDLAVDDPVRSVRKKTLFSFTPEVYIFLAQPEIILKFSSLIQDESYMIRKQTIEILGHLVPTTSASILRELLLTTLRQLPDKYNPIIPSRITDNFPHLIWASRNFIHLYAKAIYNRFIKMLNERFNNQSYNDRSLIYMNSAQLIEIDGSIIKALARVNELCPQQAPSVPIIHVLSNILMQPVHPWTKVHALKALKNICQGGEEVAYIMKNYPRLVQCLLKLIRENSSLKIVTKSLKILGTIGLSSNLPTALSKRKDVFTFRSFFTSLIQFKRYILRLLFDYLFNQFKKPMIDTKKEVIAKVITDLFVADPDSIAQYVAHFFNVFLPSFSTVSVKTLKIFLHCLTTVIKLSSRLIVPYVTTVFQAIESLWRQQYTIEASRVIRALIEAAYGQCDSMLHLVVPICFHLIKFKSQNSAIELFKLLRVTADYTPSYLSIIIQGISDIAGEPETPDNILGLCLKTLKFIVKHCDCVEYLPTIKRCVVKLKNNSGVKYKEAAISLLDAISERKNEDDDFEDDDFEPRPAPPDVTDSDPSILFDYLKLPRERDDVTLNRWYNELENKLIEIVPSPVIRALLPLKTFHGLTPKFTFKFAFILNWLNSTSLIKAKYADFLNLIFKCKELPNYVANQFIDLVEFSILSEIDLRLNIETLMSFCEKRKYYAKALLIIENSDPIFPIQKIVGLNIAMGRTLEASSLATINNISMNYKLWMNLENWEVALSEIMKTVDPSRYIYHQVVCMAALEDWDGILEKKNNFYELGYIDQVQIARYFMTAEMWNGNKESALEFMNSTNGFSVDDQIMRAIVLLKMKDIEKAHHAIHIGWRYLASHVSSIEKHNKNLIEKELFQAQQLLELSEVMFCLRKPEQTEFMDRAWVARLRNIENEPNKQKELFKIRALVPNLRHFDVHMLNIISYYIWLGQRSVAQRLCDIFFPQDSDHAKYVQCELIGKEEKIDEMLQLAEKTQSKELASRLHELVGNIKLKRFNSIEDLQDVANQFMLADKSHTKIANVNILLALATNDPKYAKLAVQSLAKCSVTFMKFSGIYEKQAVPFRLTPMIENALGRYGVQGPFSKSFVMVMRAIRKSLLPFAPLLQLTYGDPPFDKPMMPKNFLKTIGINEKNYIGDEKEQKHLDELYERMEGLKGKTFEQELEILIEKAKDIKNIVMMPAKWCPWW
ncbi:PIKK family atypical protein kinase [Histomonas meleagridis]|uniref:PIKK family atypical protein kinase n=1 Tax=Histomonas meleagridis TaxID=135588 RepID=UPI00355A11F6|nr:PIKK family atypical protein kinase [Histomonas meleagridis]KAH0804171.1 PIKK family atypical protein kinase [Histomonas meleagridis]